MLRYVVLNPRWIDAEAVTVGSWKGRLLASFATLDSAKALALQRMAYGDRAVVVVDRVGEERVFPSSDAEAQGNGEPSSGTRAIGTALNGARRTRTKPAV